jgi:hypothetical protein
VGVGQRGGQVLQAQCLSSGAGFADFAGQPLRAGQRAVDDVDVVDAGPGQVGCRQGAHRSSADDDGGPALQAAQFGVGHAECDRDDGGACGVDAGFGMHTLADCQRPLGQLVQHAADGAVRLGGGIGATDLAEHLRLANHGRVQAAGHREQVLDGGLAVADVGVFGEVGHRHPGTFGEHLADGRQAAVEGVDDRVDLDAVAGREHHGLGHQRRLHDLVDDLDLLGFVGAELFQNGDRRAAVRHTEEQDAHG